MTFKQKKSNFTSRNKFCFIKKTLSNEFYPCTAFKELGGMNCAHDYFEFDIFIKNCYRIYRSLILQSPRD